MGHRTVASAAMTPANVDRSKVLRTVIVAAQGSNGQTV
jgi:hypothetical protein